MSDFFGLSEVLRKLGEWASFRKNERLRIFSQEVAPIMKDIRETHRTFINIQDQFERLSQKAKTAILSRTNDFSDVLIEIETDITILNATINDGRELRSSLFQRCEAYKDLQPTNFSIYTTQEERDEISGFYTSVRQYFRWHSEAYRHEMRSPIASALRATTLAKGKGELSGLSSRLHNSNKEMKKRIEAFEESWALIASSFYRVEKLLSTNNVK